MQEYRLFTLPGDSLSLASRLPGIEQVETITGEVVNAGPRTHARFNPARRGGCGDTNAVVLTDHHQRHGYPLVAGPACGIDRPLSGGVIERSIAETANHHTVGRPLPCFPQFAP